MSDPIAGRLAQVYVSADDVTYLPVGYLDSVELDWGKRAMDTSQFKDTAERRADSGLTGFALSISGKLDPTDEGQALLLSYANAGTQIYAQYDWTGESDGGVKALCAIEGMKLGSKMGPNPESFSCTLSVASGSAPSVLA